MTASPVILLNPFVTCLAPMSCKAVVVVVVVVTDLVDSLEILGHWIRCVLFGRRSAEGYEIPRTSEDSRFAVTGKMAAEPGQRKGGPGGNHGGAKMLSVTPNMNFLRVRSDLG